MKTEKPVDHEVPHDLAPMPDESHLYEVEPDEPVVEEHGFTAAPTPWLDWARSKLGQKETRHSGHSNPFILGLFAKHTHYKTNSDGTAWCSAFVSAALEETGFKSMHSAWAFDYEKYGTRCEAKPGAIVVFHWPKGGGHVSIVQSVGKGTLTCCGGNQGDAVKLSTFSRAHATSYRWPVK